jgi:hypothetical protein
MTTGRLNRASMKPAAGHTPNLTPAKGVTISHRNPIFWHAQATRASGCAILNLAEPDDGMRTTLHIGSTKTGSTSIQDMLAANRALLKEHGVLYPSSLGKSTHHVIPVYAVGGYRNSELHRKVGVHKPEDYKPFATSAPAAFRAEVEEMRPEHIIISSEHLQSRIYEPAQFTRLRTLLAPALTERKLEIVVYLRPQIEHLVSLYSTMLRHGYAGSVDDFILEHTGTPKQAYFDFQALIKRWRAAFPKARMIVRPFDSTKRLPHGSVSDFVQLLKLDRLPLRYLDRRNSSMGGWGTELLHQLNAEYTDLPAKQAQIIRAWLRTDVTDGNHVRPNPELARRFQAQFDIGNAWIARTYFAKNRWERLLRKGQGHLAPNWQKLEAPQPPVPVAPQQLLDLIRRLNNQT